jgi:hypothetical protein
MPRDRSAGTFNLFTTSFLLAPIPLSQTFFAPYRSQRSAAPTTIGSLAYVDRYQSTGLPWIVIIFLPLAPLQFVLVAFWGLPRLGSAIFLGAWNRSHKLRIFFFHVTFLGSFRKRVGMCPCRLTMVPSITKEMCMKTAVLSPPGPSQPSRPTNADIPVWCLNLQSPYANVSNM